MTAGIPLDVYTVALDQATLIEASAGTGKTWTIAGLYVRLLLRHLDPGYASSEPLRPANILVVTFTKAATAELRDRIRRRLVEVREAFSRGHSDDDFCQRLITHYADQADTAEQLLDYAILSFDDAAIFTIHGFCQRVLTERAFDCGTGLDVDVVGDEDELLDEVFADLWRKHVYSADPLWVEFLLAQGEGPATWRARLQAHLGRPGLTVLGPAPMPDLAPVLDFARRRYAALAPLWAEHRDAVLRLLAEAELKVTHKPELLADAAIALDETLNGDFHWLDKPVAQALALFGNEALATATKKNKPTPTHAFCDAVSDFLTALAQLEAHFTQQLAQLRQQLLQEADHELRARKQQRKQLGFNDLLLLLDQALAGPQGPRLAALLRANYSAALIDEFQDTDPVQYAIFRRLYEGQAQPVFFVGDPKQAIYAFRGADVFTYLAARAMTHADYTLATNHRSSPALVQAVNTLFAQRSAQGDSFLDPRIRFSPVAARDTVTGGLSVTGDAAAPFHVLTLPASDKALSKDKARQAATTATVAEIVRLLALAARGEATLTDTDSRRPLAAGDIAILVSRHADGAALKAALAEHGISAVRQGQDNIWQTREAEELDHLLAALLEPGNEALVLTALGTTLVGHDTAALYALREDERAWERCLSDFRSWQQLWRQSGFMRAFRAWLSASGAVPQLLSHQDGERRLTNLLHLAELLQVASRRHHTPEALLTWYRQERQAPTGDRDSALLRLESDAARVRIVTIHASKGLEYPVVFCPFLWDGGLGVADDDIALCHDGDRALLDLGSPDFAAHQARDYDERFAERLRLLYVALTRAKWRCYTVWGWVSGMAGPAKRGDPPSASALAWLLHGPAQASAPHGARALQALAGTLDSAVIAADLQALTAAHADSFALRPVADHAERLPPTPAAGTTLAARPFPRGLSPRWRLASFSGLTAGQHQERPDYDGDDRPAAPAVPAPLPARDRFHFPRGANPGTCLHAMLEHWDFRDPARLQQLVSDQLGVHGIDTGWADTVAPWLTELVQAPMPDGFRLADVAPERRLPELEFTLPLGALDCATLSAILSDPHHGLPTAFRAAAHRLNFQQVQGYLRGFMDLVFEHAGRWYVLDWKSNSLGFAAEDYHAEALEQAMAEAHYYLQYLLYLTALTRWLRLRLPHFDYDRDIGGALYLFLRGIEPSGRYGIFQHRPSAALIEALESLFPMTTPSRSPA